MKTLILISLVSLVCAEKNVSTEHIFEISLPSNSHALIKKLEMLLEKNVQGDGDMSACINDLMDKVFTNIQALVKRSNDGTAQLDDIHLNIKVAKLNLWNGQLQDLDTISRRDNVDLIYYRNERKVKLVIPMRFEELRFSYDYQAKVTFVKITGAMHGTAQHVHVNAELSFDLEKITAFLDHYDMKHSGTISLKFTGHKAYDWLINLMSKAISPIVSQLIVNQLAKFIRENLRDLTEQLNEYLERILG